MHLAEYLTLRPVPAAGVVMALTGRCPLRCAHCSTSSTGVGTDLPAEVLLRFARSLAGPDAPRVALLTGGEPLLRPLLVRELAGACRDAGTAVFLLSGMFFARARRLPAAVEAALESVDHLSASLDVFHERQVPRSAVFAALARQLDRGKDVSLHITGAGPDDPYPDATAAAVRREFGDRVPMLVGRLAPVGRGAALALSPMVGGGGGALPCAMAAWPVVGVDGAVTACCNQQVLDQRPTPGHLRLGQAESDTWATVRTRTLTSPTLRALRTLGPPSAGCHGCRALRSEPGPRLLATVAALEAPVALLQAQAGATGFARRYGSAPHAELVTLGRAACDS
ncbi:radical SAM protein [Streptacidiphilus sp. PAMC 29251]